MTPFGSRIRRGAGRFRQRLTAWPHRHPLLPLILAIAGVGALWFAWSLVGDRTPSTDGDRFEAIDAWVEDQRSDARIPGLALAVVEGDTVVHSAGFGDDGRGNPITADTPFWIGSNTKSITALAIMQLVETGAVELDTPVQTYLPEFRLADPEASARITIRHLLNQTSGISRQDSVRVVAEGRDQTIDEVVADMAELEPNRRVGESFEYANLNSVVLGRVVEEVTGSSWSDYVQANVFDPAGMAATYTDRSTADANGLTATHRSFFGFPLRTEAAHLQGLAPTGYVYSTAGDMARYLSIYLEDGSAAGGRILGPDGVETMLTGATNERSFPLQGETFTARYGAGWFVGRFGVADDARWHQGSLPHFSAWMVLLPDSDQAVVVLMNEGNQFEIAGANATWSRIPQGVVNILRDTGPPTGVHTARFFIVVATVVGMAVVAQAWVLVNVIRERKPARHGLSRAAPLVWELGVAPLVLVAYPVVVGGFGWATAIDFIPDLSLSVLVVAGLAVLTGIVRVVRRVQGRSVSGNGSETTTSGPVERVGAGSPPYPTAGSIREHHVTHT